MTRYTDDYNIRPYNLNATVKILQAEGLLAIGSRITPAELSEALGVPFPNPDKITGKRWTHISSKRNTRRAKLINHLSEAHHKYLSYDNSLQVYQIVPYVQIPDVWAEKLNTTDAGIQRHINRHYNNLSRKFDNPTKGYANELVDYVNGRQVPTK